MLPPANHEAEAGDHRDVPRLGSHTGGFRRSALTEAMASKSLSKRPGSARWAAGSSTQGAMNSFRGRGVRWVNHNSPF